MLDTVKRLSLFFEAARDLNPQRSATQPVQLLAFFDEARPLLRRQEAIKALPDVPSVRPERLAETFGALAKPLATAKTRGTFFNVWRLAGLKRNEVRNASALAALWDAGTFPETAIPFLNEFLAGLPKNAGFPSKAELEAGYVVRTEDCPLGSAKSRVDISIEGASFLLVIEVKIDAIEHFGQLERYEQLLTSKASLLGKRPSLILLGPRVPTPGAAIHASWMDVSVAARKIGNRHRSTERTFTDQLLTQFSEHVASFG